MRGNSIGIHPIARWLSCHRSGNKQAMCPPKGCGFLLTQLHSPLHDPPTARGCHICVQFIDATNERILHKREFIAQSVFEALKMFERDAKEGSKDLHERPADIFGVAHGANR